jgi:hypothetical protein
VLYKCSLIIPVELPVPEDDPMTLLPKEVDFLFKNIFQTKGSKTSSENRYKADEVRTWPFYKMETKSCERGDQFLM